ncbi:formate dehydrogenase accessory sulfurtransferase FdhD [Paraclostridium bifermentans]|uniref:formate dehydrogenase accessory sulfurtransferase FdhD n=1 Tax=Paraclostridium bifermentans TaxID=1490 RepID=UPI00359CB436
MENIYTKEENYLIKYVQDSFIKTPIIKIEDSNLNKIDENVIGEYPLCLILNNKHINTFLCTPYNMEELIAGFLASKGYINNKNDILDFKVEKEDGIARVNIIKKQDSIDYEYIYLNCFDYIKCKAIENDIVIDTNTVYRIMEKNLTYSKLFKDTGGVHSVSIFDKDKEIIICEDVARHNAMDKAIGHCILNEISLKDKVIVVSGRISLEMISKAAKMQIPIVISKSAPTNLAIELSKKLNITLIGFVRGERMNIYTNSQRVILKGIKL